MAQDDRAALTIWRRPRVQTETGYSRSTLYLRIAQGLWPKPVRLGVRAVGWPAGEVAALNAARIAGQPDGELRALVARLEVRRRTASRKVRLMGRDPVSAGRVSQVISGHAACAPVPRSHVRWLGEPPPRRSDRVSSGGESGPPGAPGSSAASPDRCPTPSTRRARPATRPARLDAGCRHRHA